MSARLGAEQPPAALTKLETIYFSPLLFSAMALTYVYLSMRTLVEKLALPTLGLNSNLPTIGDGFSSITIVRCFI